MRVLFITRKYPPSVGGMQTFAKDLSDSLGHIIDLRLVKWGGSNRALPVVMPYLWLKAAWQLLRGGVDVIHAHDTLVAVPAFVLAKLWRKPYTVVVHGLDITYKNPLFNMLVPPAVRRADAVFCISRAAADSAERRGVAKSKIHIIPLAVNDVLYGKSNRTELVERLDLPERSQILLTVGRLVKRKGAAWFIKNVLPGLVAEHSGVVYLLVGEGEDRRNIANAVRRTHMDAHVKLLGTVDDELYAAAYNGADVFIMPNITVSGDMEGFGLVLLEASLCELPVVASGIEGILDAVTDGQNGVLVPSGDAKAFHERISHFLNDKKQAKTFGQASRRFSLENYQWNRLAERYLEVYSALTKR